MKKNLAIAITFIGGLYFILEFMLPAKIAGVANPLSSCYDGVTKFLMVLGAMAFLLGPVTLTKSEFMNFVQKKKGWIESLVFLIFLVLGIAAAAFRADEPSGWFQKTMSSAYDAIFYGIMLAFYMTSMAMISFYLVSAAYRAFRLNSVESGCMMVAASIVMVGLTPAGDLVSKFLPDSMSMASVTQWIIACPNTAVQKAVLFGACGGAFVASVKNWLNIGKSGE